MSKKRKAKPSPRKRDAARVESFVLSGPSPQQIWLFALMLLAVTALAYLPAWDGKPIWDDDAHMTRADLRSLHGLAEIWAQLGATQQYYPLVHSVFWIEQKLWGEAVLPYHLVNVLLHGLSAFLLFKILAQLKVPGAWLAAALFALHPVQVETVAWISELKNTLSGTLFFSSVLIYLRFDRTRKPFDYATSLILFSLGLLAKTAIAPLPAALLVIFWWQRGQLSWKRDVLSLLPFFAVGLAAGLFTAWVEHNYIGAHGAAFGLSIVDRFLIAGRAFWFYLFKLVWPIPLIFIYPRWQVDQSSWWQYLFPAATALLLLLLWNLRTRARGPLAAALLFLGLLFPALGFVNVYPFVFSFVADHFQYLACAAPLTLAAAGVTLGLQSWGGRKPILPLLVCVLLLASAGGLAWQQSRQYRDIETIWRTTIARNPECWMAHGNLGNLLLRRGNVDEAIAHFNSALQTGLGTTETKAAQHYNLGIALVAKGSMDQAMSQFHEAVEIAPNNSQAQTDFGTALLQQNQVDEAIPYFERAIEIEPNNPDAHTNLGHALFLKGDLEEALRHFQKTLTLPYDHAEAHYNIGDVLRRKGEIDDAIGEYKKALELRPNYANAHNNLGNALRQKGQIREAIAQYQKALQDAPQSVPTQNNLAWLLATSADPTLRDGPQAVRLAEEANRLSNGSNPVFLHTLAAAYAENGQYSEAVETAQRALELLGPESGGGLAESLRSKLTLYQARSPYHETAPVP